MAAKHKAKKGNPPRRYMTPLALLAIALLSSVVWFFDWRAGKSAQRTPPLPPTFRRPVPGIDEHQVNVGPPARSANEPTAEQAYFVQNQFLRDWDRLRDTYPILPLREKFARFLGRLARNEVRLQISALAGQTNCDIGAAYAENNQAILQFYAPTVMTFYQVTPDRETRDDVLLGVMLHEEYHLDHHAFHDEYRGPAGMRKAESEAWWWGVEEVYQPMLAAGRLRNLDPKDSVFPALNAYAQSQGNRESAAWQAFIGGVTPK